MIENKCVTIQRKNSSDFGKLIYHEQWISNSHTSFEQIFCRIMETWFSKGHKVSFLCQNIYVIWIEKHQKSKEKWVLEFTFCYKQKESLLPSQYLHISTSAFEWI